MKDLFSLLGALPSAGLFALIVISVLMCALAYAASRVERRRRVFLANAESTVGTHDGGKIAVTLGATIGRYYLLKSDGTVTGATDRPIFLSQDEGSSGDVITCAGMGASHLGTVRMIAGGAVAQYARVNTIAGGKVDDDGTSTRWAVGIALTAASADGDIIEVLPYQPTVI